MALRGKTINFHENPTLLNWSEKKIAETPFVFKVPLFRFWLHSYSSCLHRSQIIFWVYFNHLFSANLQKHKYCLLYLLLAFSNSLYLYHKNRWAINVFSWILAPETQTWILSRITHKLHQAKSPTIIGWVVSSKLPPWSFMPDFKVSHFKFGRAMNSSVSKLSPEISRKSMHMAQEEKRERSRNYCRSGGTACIFFCCYCLLSGVVRATHNEESYVG